MIDEKTAFLHKAREGLSGEQSELANKRYNNAANRAYFACFHAAIAALIDSGIHPVRSWGHDFVQAQFAGQLIGRRKLYPSSFRDYLPRNFDVRAIADYRSAPVPVREAQHAVERASVFVQTIEASIGGVS